MGRILPKRKYFRSSIFQPKLDSDSHIDNVKYSLEQLIFLNAKESENTILKKHIKVAVIITMISMIIGYIISPKGQAEVATFYPSSCLGGWNNPQHAEGESQVKNNDSSELFVVENSAVLPKETYAEIYCGGFTGEVEQNTQPIKMMVSFSWAAKGLEAVNGSVASLSGDTATTTAVSSSTATTEGATSSIGTLLTGSSTLASSTESSITAEASSTSSLVTASTTDAEAGASTTLETEGQVTISEKSDTLLGSVLDVVSNVIDTVFGNETSQEASTTTVQGPATNVTENNNQIVEQPINNEVTSPAAQEEKVLIESGASETQEPAVNPVSYKDFIFEKLSSVFLTKAFAEEISSEADVATSSLENTDTIAPLIPVTDINSATSTTSSTSYDSENATTSTSTMLSVGEATTTDSGAPTNEFLEVLYSFDGVTWSSLGQVDEDSIKYRTFEIPVNASTSWNDVGLLQIKVESIQNGKEKPVIYMDGVKVEVLYETPITHEHPDFKRDTILHDEIVNGIRMVRIINNDTNKEEVWYMHPEEIVVASTTLTQEVVTASTTATSTLNASSTIILPQISASSTANSTTSTTTVNIVTLPENEDRVIRPSDKKNVWMKLESDEVAAKGIEAIVKEIQEQERKKEFMLPDFSKDFIKKIQGKDVNAVLVQIEQEGKDSIWLFDVESDTQEKIDKDGATTFSKTYPFGMKGDNVFWLSEDGAIVYMYNVVTKKLDHILLPAFDTSLGERARVTFEGFAWEVIVGSDQFSFFSAETGEVFSDDNLSVSEAFRVKEKLDTFLSREAVEGLQLVTKAIDNEE